MALKNLFDMVKADRYTADGREAIIKAQEAETEDKVYQIGEISQKTGLQKTANGWVKPKSGKQPGAKNPDESARIAASKEARAKKSQELEQKAAGDFAKYKDLPPVQRKDALGAASHEGISIGTTQRSMEGMGWDLIQADDKVNVYGKPDGSKAIMKHDGKKITEVSYEGPGSKSAAGSKPVDKEKLLDTLSFDLVDTTADIEEEYNAVEHSDNSRLPEFVRQEIERDYVNKTNGEKWSDAEKDIIAEEVTRRIKERQSKKAAESKPQPVSPTAQVEIAEMAMTQAAGLSPAGLAKKYNISEADAKAVRKIMDDMNENARKDRATGEYPGKYSHTKNKPDGADRHDEIGDEIKGNLEAAKYYFDKAQSFSLTDPSFKTYMAKAKEYNDKAKAQADDYGFDWEEMHNRGITNAVNEFAKQNKNNKSTEAYSWFKREAGDSAPRVLTGDCRIRIRKEKPALTGDTKIRVRK